MVALTRDFSETVAERIKSDSVFARALLDEAITLFINGEADTAQSILCELADATIGFEVVGEEIQRPNPTMSSISMIIAAIKRALKVEVHTQIVNAV
ncbi:MAG: transcriptional regulator [Acetobacter sp.]|nr:transcriptional regulator [Acetobacter sp.]